MVIALAHRSGTPVRTCSAPATAATFEDLAYWQAANYLTVGQLYLRANPLLRTPLRPEHLKPVPAGPWSLCPAVNVVYTQLNRLARRRLAPTLLVVAPAEATPAVLANLWLEGTYSERVPSVDRRAGGMAELFRRYRTSGGVPAELGAHVPVELRQESRNSPAAVARFAALNAAGAALGAPTLLAACVLSEDQAEAMLLQPASDPLRSLVPGRDGAVLPVVLARQGNGRRLTSLVDLLVGHGYEPLLVAENEPCMLHASVGAALGEAQDRLGSARGGETPESSSRGTVAPLPAVVPVVVVVSPTSFEQPATDAPLGHEVPPASGLLLAHAHDDRDELAALNEWLLSYAPDELFDADGAPVARLQALLPPAPLRLGQLGRKLAERS